MDKYHIYGIGGALVDTEIEVSDKFLIDAKIDKASDDIGSMSSDRMS